MEDQIGNFDVKDKCLKILKINIEGYIWMISLKTEMKLEMKFLETEMKLWNETWINLKKLI